MVEGGAQVAASVLSSDVWDEVHVLTAPTELGSGLKAPQCGPAVILRTTALSTDMLHVWNAGQKVLAMLTFLATILSTVFIYLLFASFNRWGIRTAWAITLNYFVAAGLGWTLAGGTEAMLTSVQSDWIWPLSLIGIFFYPLFRLTATCSQELGISVATIATKLSMAIPVLVLALADGVQDIDWGQWLGLGPRLPRGLAFRKSR